MKCVVHSSAFLLLLLLITTGVRSQSEPKQQDDLNDHEVWQELNTGSRDDVDDHEVRGQGFNNGSYDEESGTGSMSPRAKPKDVPSTTDCIKPCKKAEDCYCEALSGSKTSKDVYKSVKRWCTKDGICNYCAAIDEQCGFGEKGPKPGRGYIPCCDTPGSPMVNPKYKDQRINCFYAPGLYRYQCLKPCGLRRELSCTDKNGYMTGGYVSCKGKRENTWLECQDVGQTSASTTDPVECGITDATCDAKLECCNFYKCESGKCRSKCGNNGESCSPSCCPPLTCKKSGKCSASGA